MRRTIIQGLKFLAAMLVIYLAAFYLLVHVHVRGKPVIFRTNDYYQWKGGVVYDKFAEWDQGGVQDVVVVGSSHAYRGYDPRVFAARGYRMFNLGSSAQTPLSTYAILKGYASKRRTPLVLFDLYESSFDQQGLESVSDLTQNLSSDRTALELAWSLRDLRAMNMITLRLMNRNGPAMYHDPDYKGRGFAIRSDSASAETHYPTGRGFHPVERQREYFLKCLDLCEERGIRVVLATHFYPRRSDHARHAEFATFVRRTLADRHLGSEAIHWLDLAYGHELSDTDHFCDHNHLNEAGARIFTDRLVDSLEARGFLHHP